MVEAFRGQVVDKTVVLVVLVGELELLIFHILVVRVHLGKVITAVIVPVAVVIPVEVGVVPAARVQMALTKQEEMVVSELIQQ